MEALGINLGYLAVQLAVCGGVPLLIGGGILAFFYYRSRENG
jgi:hypothetical protein